MESKRLRQRKKQEADREREMDRKQKEAIEELRLSQMKEELKMDIRDQLRSQVRAELERVAVTSTDFATLLRQLGVPVEGGSHPSEKQVSAAYKKALVTFHADSVLASSHGEPVDQVEAEEKFKLIQRANDLLQNDADDASPDDDCGEEPLRKRPHVSVDTAGKGLDRGNVRAPNGSRGFEGRFAPRVVFPAADDPDDPYHGATAMDVDPNPTASENVVLENGHPRAASENIVLQNGYPRADSEKIDLQNGYLRTASENIVFENKHPRAASENIALENGYPRAASEDIVFENGYPRAAEMLDDEFEMPFSPGDAEAGKFVPPVFGYVFDEVRRGRGDSAERSGHGGSQDLNQPPPDADDFEQPQPRPQTQAQAAVEVIEFDSDDDAEPSNVRLLYDSDGSSSKGRMQMPTVSQQRRRNGYRFESAESTPPAEHAEDADEEEEEEDSSDSDDCQVVGSYRPPYGQRVQGAANPVVVEDDDDNYTTTSGQSSDSSDVEEVDNQSEIRRRWEEAAMRRRMGRAMQSAGSQLHGGLGGAINLGDDGTESQGLEESVATSTYRDSPDSKDQTETSEARGGLEGVLHRSGAAQATTPASRVNEEQRPAATTASRVDEEQRPLRRPHPDSNGVSVGAQANISGKIPEMPAGSGRPNVNIPPGADEEYIDLPKSMRVDINGLSELDKTGTPSPEVRSASHKEEASSRSADQIVDVNWVVTHVAAEEGLNNETSENGDATGDADEDEEAKASTGGYEDLLEAKEKLKQTLQYQKTDEAEWASRQEEIQRQAMESKRLRQRKKQEADRKREMERKQKERIEELRLSQKKEERNMDIRDQLRGQVRAELERVAATCKDFATLLRQLGVPVEGGSHPSEKQVSAAYKKALFKFHPDRVVASSQGEPKYQVEAEEKFKLIQRLKDTLQPVAIDYGYPSYRSFF